MGVTTDHGRVHLAHDAPQDRAGERTTVCTDNSRRPLVVTTVLGVVDEDGHEPLLAIFHAVDIRPDRLCRDCFGPWVRESYARQWAARTALSSATVDTLGVDARDEVVIDTRLSAYVISITAPTDHNTQDTGHGTGGDRGGAADEFVVRVGGRTSRQFVEVAHAAARATARRLGWGGATLRTVTVRDDQALAAFVYHRAEDLRGLYRSDRPTVQLSARMSDTATTHSTRREPVRPGRRLAWETSRTIRGEIPTSAEGTVTITLDGTALLGIDLAAGRIVVWPDGEQAETAAKFPPEQPSGFNPAFTWTTPSGMYQGFTFSRDGHEYIEVWRHQPVHPADDTHVAAGNHDDIDNQLDTDIDFRIGPGNGTGVRGWELFGRTQHDPTSPTSMLVEFDEWRMRTTGYVLTQPYPAWTAVHGDVRDASGLPPLPMPDDR